MRPLLQFHSPRLYREHGHIKLISGIVTGIQNQNNSDLFRYKDKGLV